MLPVQDLNIINKEPLVSPKKLKEELPYSEEVNRLVTQSRKEIKDIITQKDDRMLLIIGPCSIHDEKAALEYASKLIPFREKMKEHFCIVMRVYFEKPRTTIGWKGLINDPHLNGTYDISTGLRISRRLLVKILEKGLPVATEFLDPITPQYTSDLVSWAAIGARTIESQTHREMASGLSMPVGFKNNTDGNLQIAVDAMESSIHPHHFLGIDQDGRICAISTSGNPYGHLILRGGRLRPNYDPESVKEAIEKLKERKLNSGIMVDCSHANSNKVFERQQVVWKHIVEQRIEGNKNIMGMMLESHLYEGNQKLTDDLSDLKYGVSITDACVSFETTIQLLEYTYNKLTGGPSQRATA